MLLSARAVGGGLAGAFLCALWAAHGDAREPEAASGTGSVRRVTKRGAGSAKHVYWVEIDGHSPPGQPPSAVYVGALSPELDVGDRFDIIDAHGYVGRVTVASIEDRPLVCPGTHYRRGNARFDGRADHELSMPAVAVGPVGREPKRAHFVAPEQMKGTASPIRRDTQDVLLVDLDGDDTPDLMRQYFYCPSSTSAGRTAYCFEIWARASGKWRMVEDLRVENCY
jgi:hypothetical protein